MARGKVLKERRDKSWVNVTRNHFMKNGGMHTVPSIQKWGMYLSEHVIRCVARNYYTWESEKTRILDFGCGAGAHTWY